MALLKLTKENLTEKVLVELMRSSKSVTEWHKNCDAVKAVYGGEYPPFWYESIILSGVMQEVTSSWR